MFVTKLGVGISCKNSRRCKKLSNYKDFKIRSSNKVADKDKDLNSELSLKSTITQFMQRSSIHSLNQIGNSVTTKRKVFWLIITIVGLVGSLSQIGNYLESYKTYPVVVNIHIVRMKHQKFPAVTVCNENNIRKQYFSCFLKNINYNDCKNDSHPVSFDDFAKGLYKNISKDSSCDEVSFFSNGNIALKKWHIFFFSQSYSHRVAYGHQAVDFIKSCVFNSRACSIDDFQLSSNNHLGNCYTFNKGNRSHPPYTIPSSGPNAGLELDLDIEVDDYIQFPETEGARVYIHHPQDEVILTDSGVNLSPGAETSVALKRSKMSRLPPPYKDHCINYADTDNMKKCNLNCQHNASLTTCSCMQNVSEIEGVRQCDLTNASDFCCTIKITQQECGCLSPCNESLYDMKISSIPWPSKSFYKHHPQRFMNKKVNGNILALEDVRATRLKLKVYFDTLDYTIYDQKPMYQSSELFSQVGGHLSLWLGLSLVVIFEFLENLVALAFGRCRQTKTASPFHARNRK